MIRKIFFYVLTVVVYILIIVPIGWFIILNNPSTWNPVKGYVSFLWITMIVGFIMLFSHFKINEYGTKEYLSIHIRVTIVMLIILVLLTILESIGWLLEWAN